MKNAFTLLLLVLATTLIINAQIPGGNFETWQTATMEYPDSADWTVYDEESSPEKVGLLEKSGDASDGNYAIKFNMFGTYDFGYVVYGEIGDEGPTGGIPFADDPTHLTISYKCNMATDDSARLYVFLSSSGTIITNDTFKVAGVQSSYKDTTFTLSSYTETPDSLFFGLVPCDPDNQKIRTDGLEIYFDNVRFSGGTNDLQLPDNSFEVWADTTLDYTKEMYNLDVLYEKSEEAYSGNYALKMTTINARWDSDDNEVDRDSYLTLWGEKDWIEVAPDEYEPRISGGLPVHARKDTLVFYYKYSPPAGVIDTAECMLSFEKDSMEVYSEWDAMLPTDTYTKKEVPYDLDDTWPDPVDADSMVIELSSSKWREVWEEADTNVEGSCLHIDYMYFKSQLFSVTATAGDNGAVSPTDTSIILGDSLKFTITPDEGYEIDSISYNGSDLSGEIEQSGSDFTYTADSIAEDGSFYVSFELKSYAITATVGENGTVYPADTSITHGDSLVFTITPDDGYEIDSISYNESDISDELVQEGDDFTYEVDTVTETGSLYVTFQATTGEKEVLPPKDKISIYPNPASDILYIKGTQRESLVEFVAITGAVIYQQRISGNTSLDITHIPAGLYFVKINNKVECKLYKH